MASNILNGKSCACKGIRTCLLCENTEKHSQCDACERTVYYYCQQCNRAWLESHDHPDHHGDGLDFPGIFLTPDFVSEDEETMIEQQVYKTAFVDSQSGRRKQDFGPKVNFKRRKVKADVFTGLPPFSENLFQRMKQLDILNDFIPVEQCHLEYTPERGSAIDPHFDDFWLWGERLVTVNLLSDTFLYFTCDEHPAVEVKVLMPRRCLIVVFGEARQKWKHGIHRDDIHSRRLAVTLRELSAEFLDGGERYMEGKALLDIALTFSGHAVGSVSQ